MLGRRHAEASLTLHRQNMSGMDKQGRPAKAGRPPQTFQDGRTCGWAACCSVPVALPRSGSWPKRPSVCLGSRRGRAEPQGQRLARRVAATHPSWAVDTRLASLIPPRKKPLGGRAVGPDRLRGPVSNRYTICRNSVLFYCYQIFLEEISDKIISLFFPFLRFPVLFGGEALLGIESRILALRNTTAFKMVPLKQCH